MVVLQNRYINIDRYNVYSVAVQIKAKVHVVFIKYDLKNGSKTMIHTIRYQIQLVSDVGHFT